MSSVPKPAESRTRPAESVPDAGIRSSRPRTSGLRARIAMGVLGFAVIVFLSINIPKYFTFDPDLGRLSPEEHPLYFPVLLVHVFGAATAMGTCALQVWPWLRQRHPKIHRRAGRLYVCAGVWPAAVSAVVISVIWPFGPVSALSDIMLALLWFATTTMGFVFALRRRTADHRRWMLRSFALTISIIFNRLLGIPVSIYFAGRLDMFDGNRHVMEQTVSGIVTWLPWTVAFITVEWWLDREQSRRAELRRPVSTRSEDGIDGRSRLRGHRIQRG
ncbi:DUF2306 domain-containing protein [Streptomyces tuirus]|uniref:DUF2306 domain-containing protein n=1 Tax=Streptomyces tuirus TaxID=68278 RepID=A0A941FIA7_9ACTN|nr:DUF2306 domain-containing protein [Streptomyces tuirus]